MDFFTNSIEEAKTQYCNIELIVDEKLRQSNYMILIRMDRNGLGKSIQAAFSAGSVFELYMRMLKSYFRHVTQKFLFISDLGNKNFSGIIAERMFNAYCNAVGASQTSYH